MGYSARIILDSIAPCGKRLTTMEWTYPRVVHSEVLTHRDRARNSASSRAIPFPTMTERIENEPFVPLKWGMEQSGMVTGDEIPEHLRPLAEKLWLAARNSAVRYAKALHNIGQTYRDGFDAGDMAPRHYATPQEIDEPDGLELIKIHKSIPNRIVEPWMWITVVMTATEWNNLWRLRCHPDAEVHFQKIAGMAREVLEASKPVARLTGEWHLPFVDGYDLDELRGSVLDNGYGLTLDEIKKISAARCARVSYLTHEGMRDPAKDIGLFDKLSTGSGFGHWSPMEHVAEASDEHVRSGPFIGWKQFRKEFPLENSAG